MLDMTAITNQCEDCGRLGEDTALIPYPHANGGTVLLPQCVDRQACALAAAAERAAVIEESLDEVCDAREALKYARDTVKAAEAELAERVRYAIKDGASVLDAARAAGLSRERIYQIRDRRR